MRTPESKVSRSRGVTKLTKGKVRNEEQEKRAQCASDDQMTIA